jgi:hypothetical protein
MVRSRFSRFLVNVGLCVVHAVLVVGLFLVMVYVTCALVLPVFCVACSEMFAVTASSSAATVMVALVVPAMFVGPLLARCAFAGLKWWSRWLSSRFDRVRARVGAVEAPHDDV